MFNSDYDRYAVHSEFFDILDASYADSNEIRVTLNEFDYKEQHITFQIIKCAEAAEMGGKGQRLSIGVADGSQADIAGKFG